MIDYPLVKSASNFLGFLHNVREAESAVPLCQFLGDESRGWPLDIEQQFHPYRERHQIRKVMESVFHSASDTLRTASRIRCAVPSGFDSWATAATSHRYWA